VTARRANAVRVVEGVVPVGTRNFRFSLIATNSDASGTTYNDGYADSLSFTVAEPCIPTTTTTTLPGLGTCCHDANFCTQVTTLTPGNCTGQSLPTAGPVGSVCDGTTGGCVTPPAAAGHCCETDFSTCMAGPNLDQAVCEGLFGGTYSAAGTCTTSGCTP
jgi:hypothetical protein